MQKARSKLLGAAAATCAQVPIVRISSLFIYFFLVISWSLNLKCSPWFAGSRDDPLSSHTPTHRGAAAETGSHRPRQGRGGSNALRQGHSQGARPRKSTDPSPLHRRSGANALLVSGCRDRLP